MMSDNKKGFTKDNKPRVGFRVKAAGEGVSVESRKISGYASVFGVKDLDGDIILRGAFAKSIADRGPDSNSNYKITLLWQHEQNNPIGRITVLREDEKGLYFEAELDEIEVADRALKQLESGTINQFSIGFSYVSDALEYSEEAEAWYVNEVKLYEISVVTIGANQETEYLGLKSFGTTEENGDSLAADIEQVCKGLPIAKQELIQRLVSKSLAREDGQAAKALAAEPAADTNGTGFLSNIYKESHVSENQQGASQ